MSMVLQPAKQSAVIYEISPLSKVFDCDSRSTRTLSSIVQLVAAI